MGRRAAQHVEADAAGGPMVPRRQSAPVAPLLAVPLPAVDGALRGHPDAGLWSASRPSQGLGFHNAPWASAVCRLRQPAPARCPLMGWSGRALAPPAIEARNRHVSDGSRSYGDGGKGLAPLSLCETEGGALCVPKTLSVLMT